MSQKPDRVKLLAPKPQQTKATPNAVAERSLVLVKFPPRFFAAILTVLILFTVIFVVPPVPRQENYLAAFIDKERLLTSTSGEPRIIFVGGSNSAFGIDSELIQKKLQIRTVNCGLHAAVGLRFLLNAALPKVRRGDIVVVIPEYNQFFRLFDGSTELFQLIWIHPEGARYLSLEHAKTMALAVPDIIKRKWDVWSKHGVVKEGSSPIYNRSAFNRFGDVVSHLDMPNDHSTLIEQLKVGNSESYDQRTIVALNSFVTSCKSRGAQVFLSFPSTPTAQYNYNLTLPRTSGIVLVQQTIEQTFSGTVLDAPLDNCFDTSLFFNTHNHLNKEGRRLHTEGLIKRLRPFVQPLRSDRHTASQSSFLPQPQRTKH